ncbi:Amino acid transporter avt3a [Turnera subulata]|uniref:Amino acid transporter avt3a n=1 Tax=Turnera subulata TaxID=218843 RepID=A0A9Q0JDT9_9ROSI|nr:Amino acid transporter avt3a [Turnera subulata]
MGRSDRPGTSHGRPPLPVAREDTPLLRSSSSSVAPPESCQPKTFANVFIAIVGAGVLGLPYTFKKTGWVMGSVMLFLVALLTYRCMMLLVYTRRKLESLDSISKITSYGDLGFVVCGAIGRLAVDIMIVLSQAGFCVSYLIFISNALVYVFRLKKNNRILGLKPKTVFLWSCFPFQLGLNSIPTLTHLAPLSIFADVVDIGAMAVVLVEDVLVYLQNRPAVKVFGGFSVIFYGLGVAVYSFEGMGMVLPLEAEARDKHKFGRVLGLCMGITSVIYAAFGVLGYFAFGEETRDIVTTNLGPGVISSIVQIGLGVNLFLTFPLMMNPVYEVVERRFCDSRYCLWLRWLVVLVVSLVALLVPNFADFLSLVGSSVCCCLGFVLPTLFHFLAFRGEMSWNHLALDAAILIFGVVLGIAGTWSSLLAIISSDESY